jgi:nucleoprotein TPR
LTEDISSRNARIEALEQEIAEVKATQTTSSSNEPPVEGTSSTTTIAVPDQSVIDRAVKTALSTQQAEHAKALEEARQQPAVKSEPPQVDEDTQKRLAELTAERDGLKVQVEELNLKLKGLEKQVRTFEMTRRTLERQKTTLEGKLKSLEDGSGVSEVAAAPSMPTIVGMPAAGPSTATAASSVGSTVPTPASGTSTLPAAPAPSPPVGGPAIRGTGARGGPRGRGIARPGRGGPAGVARPNSILSGMSFSFIPAQPP